MNIKLTKEQKKHLPSLQWLFKGQRGSGRTTLLAYVLIDVAMETRMTQRIFDHFPELHADRRLAFLIEQIIHENKLPLKVDLDRMKLHYRG